MAYRYECFCYYCTKGSGLIKFAKKMSRKLKRAAAKKELQKILVDEF